MKSKWIAFLVVFYLGIFSFLGQAHADSTDWCRTDGSYGVNLAYSSASSYMSAETVNLCLRNSNRSFMVYFNNQSPFSVKNQQGQVIYIAPKVTLAGPTDVYFTSWNQMYQNSGLVIPGQYTATFYPSGSVTFTILSSTQMFYPYMSLSSYNVWPGNTIQVTGHQFAPNEKVFVQLTNMDSKPLQTVADTNGNFSLDYVFHSLPFAPGNYDMYVKGAVSNMLLHQTVYVNGYYANITPSTYYIAKGSNFSLSGTGFAPNEMVDVSINGTKVTSQSADGSGNMNVSTITAPMNGTSFTVMAQGQGSGASSSRTITLAQ